MVVKLNFLADVTVEPALFFYFTGFIALDCINTFLFNRKLCFPDATTEPHLSRENLNCTVSEQTAAINAQYHSVMNMFSIIFTILATCWSDQVGRRRRPLFVGPIIGLMLQSINGCIHAYFWQWSPRVAAWTQSFFGFIGGGVVLMTYAAYMYLCDISNCENRTMKQGLLFAVRSSCLPIGKGIAGFIVQGIGFFYSYLLCFAFSLISLILALIFIKDVSVPEKKSLGFVQFFNLRKVLESFRIVFKENLGSKRIVISLLIINYVLLNFITYGEKTVFYPFLQKKFHWNEKDYSTFLASRHVGVIIGSVFCSLILSRHYTVHDGIIGVFASFWDTIAAFGFLFANQTWHFFAVLVMDIFHGTALTVSISYLSKYYNGDEFGRLSSVLNVFLLITPLCHLCYNKVFQQTQDYFPSAFFIVSIVLNIGAFTIYFLSYFIGRKFEISNERRD